MRKKLLFLIISIGATFTSVQSINANPNDKPPLNGQDSVEWVALWGFPQSREEQLERMITTELQRRTLYALQEKRFLKAGKENLYSFDPFQVTNIRQIDGGFYELDVLASVHRVTNVKIDKKAEKYLITFRHNYDYGFIVTNVRTYNE